MDNKVAYCVCTYERPEVIRDFFEVSYGILRKNDIDVYIFDSSKGDETREYVEKFSEEIKVKKVSSEMGLSEKVLRIMEGSIFAEIKDYDYVWISGDANQFSEEVIRDLLSALSECSYDMAVLAWLPTLWDEKKTYTDKNVFFKDCCHKMTLLGSVVMKVSSMFVGVEWEKYFNTILEKPIVDWAINAFYFDRLAELDEFNGVYLPYRKNGLKYSLKKKTTHWQKRYYEVICEGWYETIHHLPDCYWDKRATVMKIPHMRLDFIGSLYAHRRRGYYSYAVFRKYRDRWENVTIIPKQSLFWISIYPRTLLWIRYYIRLYRLLGKMKRLRRRTKRLLIYGAGDNGYMMKCFLENHKIAFDGFCCTFKGEKEEYHGYKLYSFEDLGEKVEETGFVLAMTEDNAIEVITNISESVDFKQILYEPLLYNHVLAEEAGFLF